MEGLCFLLLLFSVCCSLNTPFPSPCLRIFALCPRASFFMSILALLSLFAQTGKQLN